MSVVLLGVGVPATVAVSFASLEAGNGVSVVYRRDDGSYGLIETPAAS